MSELDRLIIKLENELQWINHKNDFYPLFKLTIETIKKLKEELNAKQ